MNYKLNEFGEKYITEVYDNSIEDFEMIFDGRMKGVTAQNIRKEMSSFDEGQKEIILWLITKSVEKCVHNMLFMLEAQKDIRILYKEENIVELSDGLAGELYSEDGWISKYSKYADNGKMVK